MGHASRCECQACGVLVRLTCVGCDDIPAGSADARPLTRTQRKEEEEREASSPGGELIG